MANAIPEIREDSILAAGDIRYLEVRLGNQIYESYLPGLNFPFEYLASGMTITLLFFSITTDPIPLARPVSWLKAALQKKAGALFADYQCLECHGPFDLEKILPGEEQTVPLKTMIHILGHLLLPVVESLIIGPKPVKTEESAFINPNNRRQICLAINAKISQAVGGRLDILIQFLDHLIHGREVELLLYLQKIARLESEQAAEGKPGPLEKVIQKLQKCLALFVLGIES